MTKRVTWQREAVREALSSSEGFVSAQSLHSSLRDSGSPIGLATVYRALSDLAVEGEADSLQQEGESLYRACTPGSHHHHGRRASHKRSITQKVGRIRFYLNRVLRICGRAVTELSVGVASPSPHVSVAGRRHRVFNAGRFHDSQFSCRIFHNPPSI